MPGLTRWSSTGCVLEHLRCIGLEHEYDWIDQQELMYEDLCVTYPSLMYTWSSISWFEDGGGGVIFWDALLSMAV